MSNFTVILCTVLFTEDASKMMPNLMFLVSPFVEPIQLMPFSLMPFCLMPFTLMPFSLMPFSLMPLSLMPFSIMPFSIMPISLMPSSLTMNCENTLAIISDDCMRSLCYNSFISSSLSLCHHLWLLVTPQFGVSLSDDSRGVIYDRNVLIGQRFTVSYWHRIGVQCIFSKINV